MNSARPAAAEAARPPSALPVPVIPDHELLRRIGGGSYGEVWLARNAIGSLHAVKIIHRKAFPNVRPFEREFEGIQKAMPVSRAVPGLVQILHVGRNDAAGYFYYVMELADSSEPVISESVISKSVKNAGSGPTDSLITDYSPRTLQSEAAARGPLPVEECVTLGLTLTEALGQLHAQGLVHRDVKPSNIIFVRGAPKLADIGLMASTGEAQSFVGTAGFIPPEGPGTPQADLYSLGKVLYEISTGKDRSEFPQLPGDLAEQSNAPQLVELNVIILKACQPDARARYQAADEMRTELKLLHDGESVKRKRANEHRLLIAKKLSLAGAAIIVFAIGLALVFKRFNGAPVQLINGVPEVNSIAVLPFVNESTNRGHQYLSDAISDETMNALTNCAGLRVASRASVLAFKRTTNDLQSIGRQLSVRTVLAGGMNEISNRIYVAARLINTADSNALWSATYDPYRSTTNTREVALQMVTNVAQALNVSLPDSSLRSMETNFARKLAAHRLYSQAITNHRNTQDGIDRGIRLLSQAIGEDPNYAAAFAELAYCYEEASGFYLPQGQAMEQAKAYARHALEIDEAQPVAHLALGMVSVRHDLNLAQATNHFERAIALGSTDSRFFGDYAYGLSFFGQFTEAERILKRGERIDPNGLFGSWCWRYYLGRDFEAMKEAAHRLQAKHPDGVMGPWFLSLAFEGQHRYEDALTWAERTQQMDPSPDMISQVGRLHARLGQRTKATNALEQMRLLARSPGVERTFAAEILLALGETNRALDRLEVVVAEYPPTVLTLRMYPLWDELRGHPRFQALLKKMK